MNPFDFKWLTDPHVDFPAVAIIGPRRTGKTHNVLRILFYYVAKEVIKPENVFIFKNSQMEGRYPREMYHKMYDWDPAIALDLWEKRERAMQTKNVEPMLIILDDITEQTMSVRYTTALRKLLLYGRHAKIYIIISCHDFVFIPKDIRTSIDYYIFTRIDDKETIDWIKKYEIYEDFRRLRRLFRAYATDADEGRFSALVLKRTAIDPQKRWTYLI